MGLLGEIYSAGDSAKRKLKGLLSDPLGELGLLGARASEDMQTFLDTGAKAYPMLDPRLKPRLDTPQGREMVVDQNVARRQFGDMAGNMGMAAATVWHGSPHKFDRFDSSKIGTGEGAQAYGHGLYLAESPAVADTYRAMQSPMPRLYRDGVPFEAKTYAEMLAESMALGAGSLDEAISRQARRLQTSAPDGRGVAALEEAGRGLEEERRILDALRTLKAEGYQPGSGGSLYKVDLPDEAIAKMLDWDKPLSQQAPDVQRAVKDFADLQGIENYIPRGENSPVLLRTGISGDTRGQDVYRFFGRGTNSKDAADTMRFMGIPGIRYLDGGSRGAGTGTRNYVVFPGNEGLLTILERNGVAP